MDVRKIRNVVSSVSDKREDPVEVIVKEAKTSNATVLYFLSLI